MSVAAMTVDEQKAAAAQRAVALVESGMVVGLGSGTTAAHAVLALAARIAQGLRIRAIPTSERIAALARRHAVALIDFAAARRIDLDIDGADVIERGTLTLVKGKGGALLREKLVAAASRRMLVIADQSKLVARIAPGTVIPVEISAFGHETVLDRLAASGVNPILRRAGEIPFVTDGGNFIADCTAAALPDAAALALRLKSIIGVIETGLFIGLADAAFIGRPDGVEVLER